MGRHNLLVVTGLNCENEVKIEFPKTYYREGRQYKLDYDAAAVILSA